MEFEVKIWLLMKIIELTKSDNTKEYLQDEIRYKNKDSKVKISSLRLNGTDLQNLADLARDHYNENVPDKNNKSTHNKFYPFIWLSRKIESAMEIEQNSDGTIRVKALDQIPLAMKAYFKQFPHKIVFKKNDDGWMLPYVVREVKFIKPDRGGKSYCTIEAVAMFRGSTVSINGTWDYAKKTCDQLLKELHWIPENDKLLSAYSERIERYRELLSLKIGQQVNLINMATANHGWVPMTIDGNPTKAVLDDISDARESDRVNHKSDQRVYIPFWNDQDIQPLEIFSSIIEEYEQDEDEDLDTRVYTAYPLHPYIKCFDLAKHRWVTIHVANIEDYKWNHNLADKLVLDEETKSLIEILVDSTKERSEDIISGKMSGTIVLATGVPGVGKTLTAEVFSEKIEKSLYIVQCSQLGIDIDSIETKLTKTLDRAGRWGSILLIDEADVYIRDRGTDIVHNAIVGVFLRLIEYYNGVLFMTSNRGDIIDDAIISRCTAWIRYNIPNDDLLAKIWKVLSIQFQVILSDSDITDLVKAIPKISGRTVRNLLKLVKALEGGEKTKETNYQKILRASKFQKLED